MEGTILLFSLSGHSTEGGGGRTTEEIQFFMHVRTLLKLDEFSFHSFLFYIHVHVHVYLKIILQSNYTENIFSVIVKVKIFSSCLLFIVHTSMFCCRFSQKQNSQKKIQGMFYY